MAKGIQTLPNQIKFIANLNQINLNTKLSRELLLWLTTNRHISIWPTVRMFSHRKNYFERANPFKTETHTNYD